MSEPRKIALFGGTFDPIHNGHLEIAAKAVEALGLDRVIFIPCRQSPHKAHGPQSSDADRVKMLDLATSALSWARVDDFELKKPPPSYTWETVSHFKSKSPTSDQFYLLIGADQWEKLPDWGNIEFLCKEVTFLVVGRQHDPEPRDGFNAHFLKGNHPASASQIREHLSKGKPAQWLPESVSAFIDQKGLYSPTS